MKKQIEAVVFDKDGLMINSEQINAKAFRLAIEELKIDLLNAEKWYYKNCSGRRRDYIFQVIKSILNIDVEFMDVLNRFGFYIKELWKSELRPKKGLIDLLEFLKQNKIKMAIATSGTQSDIEDQFKIAGIPLDYFSCIIQGFDVKEAKPHPQIYQIACERLGVTPSHAVALEDSDVGIEAAYRAGMVPILVPDVILNSEETKKKAFKTIPSLDELIPILESLIVG